MTTPAEAVSAMLEARSIALVGASARPGSLGARMIAEVARSLSRPRTYLVNPRYADIGGARCLPSLADVPEPVDLVLLAVPDAALEEQLGTAARRGDRAAVIFGSAFGMRDRLAATAASAGMAVCGAGCMGFVNVARGLRAIGYVEPDLTPGPVALITHSGSVFSAMLRARRGFGFSVAVSSGQELVTTAAAYARYALGLPETRVLALVLEAIRDAPDLRAVLGRALAADVPVVLLSVGGSDAGRALVSAHSGALAAADGAWEALAGAYGVHRVHDLAELADTLELFAPGRRAPAGGIATVHDSGLERAHVADLAAALGVPFGALGSPTRARLAAALDPGLERANPLDVWGTGRDPEPLFAECLSALAADPAIAAVALAVDLVPEYDGDDSYPRAVLTAASGTGKPVAVLAGLASAVDPATAARLRAAGVPVLEGTRSGLVALRHLLEHADPPPAPPAAAPPSAVLPSARADRWQDRLAGPPSAPSAAILFDLLRDYGLRVVRTQPATTPAEALKAAAEIGYPVVLKTDEPGIPHKSDVGGVRLGLGDPGALAAAYDEMAGRLGPRALVCETAAPGTELALGLTRDPTLGPLVVVSAGGVLIEIFSERAVVLPPVTHSQARAILNRLRIAAILAGARGQPPADLDAAADAIVALSRLACDLGDALDALDINPLICGPSGAVAADILVVPRRSSQRFRRGLPGPGRRAVASQDLRLVPVPRRRGAVRVQDQRPAPPVDDDVMVEPAQEHAILDAGFPAASPVLDVVDFTCGGGLPAATGPLAVLVPEPHRVPDPGRDVLTEPDVQRQARPTEPGPSWRRRRNDASPPGPDSRSMALPMIAFSRASRPRSVGGCGSAPSAPRPGPYPASSTPSRTRSSIAPGLTSPVTTGMMEASQANPCAASPSSHAAPSPPATDAAARAAAHWPPTRSVHSCASADPGSRASRSAREM